MTADSLVSLYWSSPDGYACLNEFLATNLPLHHIEAWWEAGIATADGAQCLQAAGIRPTQVRFVDWVRDLAVIDLIVAALAPISWVADGPADAAEIGPYEATAADTQYTVWHAGTALGTRPAASRRRARQQAERWIRADARRRLPAWERSEPAR